MDHLKSCICKQSKVGCNLYEDKLPLDPQLINVCEEFDIDSTTVAINGGEDYELLLPLLWKILIKLKETPFLHHWTYDTGK
jgi:thiamine-monophosphate kinase